MPNDEQKPNPFASRLGKQAEEQDGQNGAKPADPQTGAGNGEPDGEQTPNNIQDVSIQEGAQGDEPTQDQSEAERQAKEAAEILAAADAAPAGIRTSIDTADLDADVGVVAAVDRAPDADTVMVHPQEGVAQFAQNEAQVALEAEDDSIIYSSHPVRNLKIGDYQFVDSQLRLKPGREADKFAKLLEALPPREKAGIVRVDRAAAEAYLKERFGSRSVSGMDTSANSYQS